MEEIKRVVGNRRSNEELEAVKEEANKTRFTLMEQPDFKGTREELEFMQKAERAYREGHPIISDLEWDKMVKEHNYLESLDEIVSPNGRKWYQMKSPLVSIFKATTENDVKEYMKKYPGPWSVQPKMDGITFNAVYEQQENGSLKLKYIGSRGDGRNSLIIFETALWGVNKHGLPEVIDSTITKDLPVTNGIFELRGEIVVKKSDYPDSVHRTISSGICNRKSASTGDGKGVGIAGMNYIDSLEKCESFDWPTNRAKKLNCKRTYYNKEYNCYMQETEIGNSNYQRVPQENLYFISFSFSDGDFNNGNINIIKNIPGIRCVDSIKGLEGIYKETNDPEEVIKSIREFYGNSDNEGYIVDLSKRKKLQAEFAIDGIVVKQINDSKEAQGIHGHVRGGKLVIEHHPANVIAIKLKSIPALTKIEKINYKETSLGNMTVTADVTPFVAEDGKIVKQLNLHNPQWLEMKENQYLKEGAEIIVYQSCDIISVPQPLNSVPEEILEQLRKNK